VLPWVVALLPCLATSTCCFVVLLCHMLLKLPHCLELPHIASLPSCFVLPSCLAAIAPKVLHDPPHLLFHCLIALCLAICYLATSLPCVGWFSFFSPLL
jgi:hypothetical protein